MTNNIETCKRLRDLTRIIDARPDVMYKPFYNPMDAFANLCAEAMKAYEKRDMDPVADALSAMEETSQCAALELLLDPSTREFMREYVRDGWRTYMEVEEQSKQSRIGLHTT